MKITNVKLQNFRGIKDMELELSPRLNVISGANGSGKSSLLQALSLLLTQFTARLAETKNSQMTDDMVHNRADFAKLSITCDDEDAHWTMVRHRTGKLSPHKSSLEGLNRVTRRWKTRYTESPDTTNFPLIAYYPTSRIGLDIPKRIRKQHDFTPLHAYDGHASFGVDFRLFFEWFRQRQEMEMQRQVKLYKQGNPAEAAAAVDPQLKAVRAAMMSFFPGFSDFCVGYNPLRMELTKEGEILSFGQLSDGEKAFLSLVADIAFRLCLANPHLDRPLEGAGIILIDEIELHLHPEWQKDAIPNLLRTFPNCQFVLTTHSPMVLNRTKEGHIIALARQADRIINESVGEQFGYRPEKIMTSAMGVSPDSLRPESVSATLSRLFLAIDSGSYDTAEQLIDELHGIIPDDAELVRARMLIKRKKLLSK